MRIKTLKFLLLLIFDVSGRYISEREQMPTKRSELISIIKDDLNTAMVKRRAFETLWRNELRRNRYSRLCRHKLLC